MLNMVLSKGRDEEVRMVITLQWAVLLAHPVGAKEKESGKVGFFRPVTYVVVAGLEALDTCVLDGFFEVFGE